MPGDRTRERLLAAGCALPLVACAVFVARYALDVPRSDDYDDVLRTLLRLGDAASPGQWLGALFSQHNVHRTLVPRLVYALDAQLFGRIDFLHLIVVGNLAALGLAAGYHRELRRGPHAWALTLVACLILFQPQAYDGMLWAMAAVSNFWSVLFGFLALQALCRRDRVGLAAGVAFAALASFTQANGQLIFPLGLLLLLGVGRGERRGRSAAGLWIVAACLILTVFYLDWSLSRPAQSSLGRAAASPVETVLSWSGWLLAVLGAPLSFSAPALARPAGALLLAAVAGLGLGGFRRRSPALFYFLLFLLGSLALLAAVRHVSGPRLPFESRYRFYSLQLWALVAVSWLRVLLIQRPRLATPALVVGVLLAAAFNAASWQASLPAVARQHTTVLAGMRSWMSGAADAEALYGVAFIPDAGQVLAAAIARGLYDPTPLLSDSQRPKSVTDGPACSTFARAAPRALLRADDLQAPFPAVQGSLVATTGADAPGALRLAFCGAGQSLLVEVPYTLDTEQDARGARALRFAVRVPRHRLAPGPHATGLVRESAAGARFHSSSLLLELPVLELPVAPNRTQSPR